MAAADFLAFADRGTLGLGELFGVSLRIGPSLAVDDFFASLRVDVGVGVGAADGVASPLKCFSGG